VTTRPAGGVTQPPAPIRRITTMTPMLNEAKHVETLIQDIAAQDFTGEIEVLVADGGSTDGSPERILEVADRAGLNVTVLPNPGRWVSPGLNACILRATGELLVRLDCHARYSPDHLRRHATLAKETGAWATTGVIVPIGVTWTERAVACATDSPFGGAHWSRHNAARDRVDVDVVWCGAFLPEAFRRAGVFDETLVRNQDDELTLRFRRAGGRVILDPAIRARYVPRGSYRGAFRQYYEYGFWKVAVMLKHRQVVSARSIAPLAFVCSLGALVLAGGVSPKARRVLAAEAATYAGAAAAFGLESIRRRAEPFRLLPRVMAAYPTYHLGFGLGLLHGVLVAALEGRAGFERRADVGRRRA
jgi:succinoglycan biosynthesis protein ExoA